MARLSTLYLWLVPGMRVKRYVLLAVLGALILISGVTGFFLWLGEEQRQLVAEPIEALLVSETWRRWGSLISLFIMVFGLGLMAQAVVWMNRSLLSNWMPRPRDAAIFLHRKLSLSKGPHIVALGGGSGLSNLLRGLKHYSSNITAVVTASDDGGSSGRLRTAFGMPAPGDLNDCLAALSDSESQLSKLLEYRFTRGGELMGHTFGNLFITTLTEVEGDFAQAIRALNSVLNISGAVYPVTAEPVKLCFKKRSGAVVEGESLVREASGAVEHVYIVPENPALVPEVAQAIHKAHLIVLGPGSLFTSTIPPLLVPACREAIAASRAPIVYVCNIMTEAGETDGFSACDHVQALKTYLGRYPDMVLLNSSAVDPERLARYHEEGADTVSLDRACLEKNGMEVVGLPLLGKGPHAQHDGEALASWLTEFSRSQARIRRKD